MEKEEEIREELVIINNTIIYLKSINTHIYITPKNTIKIIILYKDNTIKILVVTMNRKQRQQQNQQQK